MKNTTLSFGLVNVPVGLEPFEKSTRYSSLRIIAPSGQPAKQVYIDPDTGETYDGKNDPALRRGVPRGKDAEGNDVFAIVDPAAWDGEEDRLQTAEVLGFVPDKDLAPYLERINGSHVVKQQRGVPPRAAGLLREAMRMEKCSAVVRWSAGTRERLGLLRVRPDRTLVLHTLAHAERWREADADARAVAEVEVGRDELKMARELVRAQAVGVEVLDEVEDGTEARKMEVIERVLGEAPALDGEAVGAEGVTDLMAALEQSMADAKKQGKKVAA